MNGSAHTDVVVVGAGITGLLTAQGLRNGGVQVTVLEGSDRIGGQLLTQEIAGLPVDVGAEAVAVATPAIQRALDDLAIGSDPVTANPSRTLVATPGGLRRLPAGVGPAGPSQLGTILRADLLSQAGKVRAGLEPLRARRLAPLGTRDVAVGTFLQDRFGPQVVERIVDPLLGNLHGGEVSRLSLRACTPTLVAAAEQGTSLLRTDLSRPASPTIRFTSWPQGMTTLTEAAAAGLPITTGDPVVALFPTSGGYRVRRRSGAETVCTAVVLAIPPWAAQALVQDLAKQAALQLQQVEAGSVATCVAVFDRRQVAEVTALDGTGIMVPSTRQRVLKSATFLSSKWPHLADPEHVLIRMSAGRAGNDLATATDEHALVAGMLTDLASLTGLRATPSQVRLHRWPSTMPQLTVGHLERLAKARADLAASAPGVYLAGSGYDGVGIATSIRSAHQTAATILTQRTVAK